MNNITISKYIKLFEPLSLELKIELLSALTDSIKKGLVKKEKEVDKEKLGRELFGAWADVDDDITAIIYDSRTTSDREINFD